MKKKVTLFALLTILLNVTYAQAPQGFNYQAVAYNASGSPVSNQPISVRLSILDSSASGTVVYEETQDPSTDNTGLFSIVIGNGTVVSGVFKNINWGNGSKWLKTEIDITGGTNYIAIGTTQFMSVPYALYANKASYSSGSFTIPDGFDNATTVILQDSVPYTVPTGKNLYISSAAESIIIDGDTLFTGFVSTAPNASTFVGASEGSIVLSPGESKVCFLVNKTVTWKTTDINQAPFTVPAGKQFVIVNYTYTLHPGNIPSNIYFTIADNCTPTLNGIPIKHSGDAILANTIIDEGNTLSTTGCIGYSSFSVINGYFKDKN